jgi:hypothetical protein
MLVFPQLVTGAAALYPLTKRLVRRTAVNDLSDGSKVMLEDPDAATSDWELRAKGLTETEAAAIEALFDAAAGRWKTFTFLDPAGNLLANSEEFDAPTWSNGPLIQLTPGIADPFGTMRATTAINVGFAAQGVTQVLAAPGTFQYCLSVWAKDPVNSEITLSLSTAGANATKSFAITSQWVRLTLSGSLAQSTEQVTFGVQLAAGTSVDLFGMQVEAQPAASDYKRTGAAGGVRSNARFADDRIRVTAQGTDVYDAVIRIASAGS